MTQTAQRLLADIRELVPHVTSRAAEIETGRRIPLDLVEALRSIGVFRMFVPQSHGGLELDLPTALEVIAALGRLDGSVAWTAMIGAGSAIFVPYLPRETYDQVYHNGPDMIIAASAQPAGMAEAVPGGWRITGRWPFMSGCQHADWILGFCTVTDGRNQYPDRPGRTARQCSGDSCCRRATGRSRTLGTSQGSRVREAIMSRSGTRWSQRRIPLIR